MNELKIFQNTEFGNVRTIEENGKVMFCGKDVAKALGYGKTRNAISVHCKGALKRGVLTNGGVQEMLFITEGDVYRLITHSRLPGAERFERWVFDEVLPQIRKNGGYGDINQIVQKCVCEVMERIMQAGLISPHPSAMLTTGGASGEEILRYAQNDSRGAQNDSGGGWNCSGVPICSAQDYAGSLTEVMVGATLIKGARRRSPFKLNELPTDVFCEVIRGRVLDGMRYEEISDMLRTRGYDISRGAVWRFFKAARVIKTYPDRIELLMVNNEVITVFLSGEVRRVICG